MTRALITGVAGMDGRHLADQLRADGVKTFGMLRHPDHPTRGDIEARDVTVVTGDLLDGQSLRDAVAFAQPDIIYHLGALSAPGVAWQQPELCAQVTGIGTLRLLQAVAAVAPHAKVIAAGSMATHGPYGAAKTYARAIAADCRDRGLAVSTIVMGGHHSPLRGASYLSQKVALHVKAVRRRETTRKLRLGWLGRRQDWGWAPDFMRVWAAAGDLEPGDYTLSTGDPYTVQAYVAGCYEAAGLRWLDWVDRETTDGNPNATDVPVISAEPDAALGLVQTKDFDGIVGAMIGDD